MSTENQSDRQTTADAIGIRTPSKGLAHLLLHRKRLVIGGLIIGLFIFVALFAPLISPMDPLLTNLDLARQPPSLSNPLGTDELGRDVMSRLFYGGRVTLIVAVVALLISSFVGTAIGLMAGFLGGHMDDFLMRIIDIQLAFPGVILAIAIIAIVGPGLTGLIIALSMFPIPSFARLSRATTLVVMQNEYILAARSIGAGPLHILLRHILPNIIGPLLVQASLSLPGIILVGSSLGFLGLGVQPPTPEWGVMLSRGRNYVMTTPYLSIFPGLAVTLVVLGFTLAGDALRDMLDPHLRKLET